MKYILAFLFFNILSINIFAQENKEIKIAYYDDFYPFSFKKEGKIQGIFIDYTTYILENKLLYKVTSEGFPWERAQMYVKSNEFDAHVTLKNKEREKFLLFGNVPLYRDNLVIIYSKNNPKSNEIKQIKSKEDLKKFIINDYIGNGVMKTHYPRSEGFNINLSAKLSDSFYNLMRGNGDILITQKIFSDLYKKNDKENVLTDFKLEFLDVKGDFLFCIRKNYPNAEKIVELFDKTLQEEIKNKNIQKMFDKNINYYIKQMKE